jgi:hypothetical protein
VSGICINAYEIDGTERMAWPVRRYAIRRRDGMELRQEDRGRLKDAAFGLRRDYRAQCSGYGFIIDVDERTLVVPKTWVFPSGVERDGLIFDLTDEFDARPIDPEHDLIVAGILREGLKRHLKDRPRFPLAKERGLEIAAPSSLHRRLSAANASLRCRDNHRPRSVPARSCWTPRSVSN